MTTLDSGLSFSVGEVASMLGVSPHTIRAWERRYRTLHPVRTSSGQRRYSPEDIELLRQIKFERHAHGLSMRLATMTAQGSLVPEDDVAGLAEERDPTSLTHEGTETIQMVANLVDEIILVLDQEGRIEDANTAFLRFSDLLPRRVRGLRFVDFVDPFDRAKGVNIYASPPRRRRGWELNLRGSRRRALFAFDCWPVTRPGGPRVILIGTEVAAGLTGAGAPAAHPVPDEPPTVLPAQLLALLDGAPDPVRVFDLFDTWMTSSPFGVALASVATPPSIIRANPVFERVATGARGISGFALRDLWGGRPNDPLAVAVERAARSSHTERIGGWIAPSRSDDSRRVYEVEIVPLHGPSGDVTHLLLRVEDAGARMLPKYGDQLLAAVVALRTATDAAQVHRVAADHARDLIRDAEVLVAHSAPGSAPSTITSTDGPRPSGGGSEPDLRFSLMQEAARTGAHLDLRWDTGEGREVIRAVPVASRQGSGVLAVIVFGRRDGDVFAPAERGLMDEFADRVALALDSLAAPARGEMETPARG